MLVLVLGAGGGLAIRALADARPGWMFDLARKTLGPLMSRVVLHEGYIDDAPAGSAAHHDAPADSPPERPSSSPT